MKYFSFYQLTCLLVACVLLTSLSNVHVGGAAVSTETGDLKYDLKLANIGSKSAEIEILDDNKTTINYEIEYSLSSDSTNVYDSVNNKFISNSIRSKSKSFRMQTNSLTLLAAQEAFMKENNIDETTLNAIRLPDAASDGELINTAWKEDIQAQSYEQAHRIYIGDLEPNRYYELDLSIQASKAYLSSLLTKIANPSAKQTVKQFKFKFKTIFDYDLAISLACNNSLSGGAESAAAKMDPSLFAVSSCYESGSRCSKCKSSCYEVKRNKNEQGKAKSGEPVLCEACPCDTSRSTGECVVIESANKDSPSSSSAEVKSGPAQTIQCKKCIKPYTGLLCNECENEGIDYYKTETNECMPCSCNGNAATDNFNNDDVKKPRCHKITGK
jgi:hypothetical protein